MVVAVADDPVLVDHDHRTLGAHATHGAISLRDLLVDTKVEIVAYAPATPSNGLEVVTFAVK